MLLTLLFQDSIRVHAVGDVMIGSHYPNRTYLPDSIELSYASQLFPELSKGDIVFGNFEGTFLDEGVGRKVCEDSSLCYLFKTPCSYNSILEQAGFTLMSLANNHSFDFGKKGQDTTAIYLNKANILYAGTERFPYIIFYQNTLRFAFIAFANSHGMPQMNERNTVKNYIQHLDTICDIVIVSFHGGAEGNKYQHVTNEMEIFHGENRGNVIDFAHLAIDCGADLVLGHGPHVLRAVELYQNKLIAYSLGNFWTYGRFSLSSFMGISAILKIVIDRRGNFMEAEIVPIIQLGRGIPTRDPKMKASHILKSLTETDFPKTQLQIQNNKIYRLSGTKNK